MCIISWAYIKFSLGFGKTGKVLGIHEEDNSSSIRKVILPETTGLYVTTEIVGGEAYIADTKLLRGYNVIRLNSCAEDLLGWRVGWREARRSFLSMCKRVVFPALSRPRKRIFPFLLLSPDGT